MRLPFWRLAPQLTRVLTRVAPAPGTWPLGFRYLAILSGVSRASVFPARRRLSKHARTTRLPLYAMLAHVTVLRQFSLVARDSPSFGSLRLPGAHCRRADLHRPIRKQRVFSYTWSAAALCVLALAPAGKRTFGQSCGVPSWSSLLARKPVIVALCCVLVK